MKRSRGALIQGWYKIFLLRYREHLAGEPLRLSEEETCLSVTYSSCSSDSEDSNDEKETSIKENAAHVYSELTTIRDKLHVRYNT